MDVVTVEAVLAELSAPGVRVGRLLVKYQAPEDRGLWAASPALYRAFGRRLIMAGHPTGAFELVREGLAAFPADRELLYLKALALARGGNAAKAAECAAELLRLPDLEPALAVEARGLAGRVLKDRYQQAADPARKAALASESARAYLQARDAGGGWYAGVNAATMFLLAGDAALSRDVAAAALAAARAAADRADGAADHWLAATLGELALLLGRGDEAERWYRLALERAAGLAGDVASIRRQVRLLADRLPIPDAVLALLRGGPVVVFAGHMIDHPARARQGAPPRFPPDPALEALVREAVRAELDRLRPVAGYCSGACGSDLIFAELLVDRGAELGLVLPFAKEDFYATSVDFGLPEMADYRRRFDALAGRDGVHVHQGTEEGFLGDETLFELASSFAGGLALLRAEELGVDATALVVLDPASPTRVGGTAWFQQHWTDRDRPCHVIDLAALRARTDAHAPAWWAAAPAATATPRRGRREVKVMLFADVKNYSQLREEQAPAFFQAFLGEVLEVIQATENCPVFCNTWGDGLFLVFDQPTDAAEFALRLLERINGTDWGRLGLPADTTVRIGLHAGPVYPHWDRLIGRQNFFGTHVNRAARIEPVTMPGCVYASEQFAALLAVAPGHAFACAYLGTETLGKAHDRFRCVLYRLMRKAAG